MATPSHRAALATQSAAMLKQTSGRRPIGHKRKYSALAVDAEQAPSPIEDKDPITRQDALDSLARYRQIDRMLEERFGSNTFSYSTGHYQPELGFARPGGAPAAAAAHAPYSSSRGADTASGAPAHDGDHEIEFELNTDMGLVWRDMPESVPPSSLSPWDQGMMYQPNGSHGINAAGPGLYHAPQSTANMHHAYYSELDHHDEEVSASQFSEAVEQLSYLGTQLQDSARQQMRCVGDNEQ